MRPIWIMSLVMFFLLLGPGWTEARAGEPKATAEQVRFFESAVRPVLANQCFRCHGPKKQRGELRLDSRAAILKGGTLGPAAVAGNPADSRFIKAIHYQGDLEMPPDKKLSKKEIADLTEWVRLGLPWPGTSTAAGSNPRPQAGPFKGRQITDQDRQYWAFQLVKKPAIPVVADDRPANAIDAFVVCKLRDKGLSFSPAASRQELIRRVYFDLIGLPPAPQDVDAFLRDNRSDAYERLIDRLLAMPQYGERWGRHWLDVVRFGQTNGYERDDEKPNAWRYRDYVIRAFNDDKPYDQFIREQLAGDELEAVTDDTLTATAFFRLGVWDDEPDDARQAEFDQLDDMLSTSSTAFLGLTLGCARCHEHKFDPIEQEDYYGMLAFVRNIKPYAKPDKNSEQAIFSRLKSGGQTLAVHELGPTLKPTYLLIRGSAASPSKEVQPRFIQVLCPSNEAAEPRLVAPSPGAKSSGRRRALAEWIASPNNPLTARVLVNRLWHYHFGRGIVPTPSDFGRTGLAPTHPELLDWLAAEFVDNGWRIKPMHKLILLSRAYRQSSRVNMASVEASARREGASPRRVNPVTVDPGNTLLWRQNMRRLEAEAIRDAILSASGQLNLKMGGRGFFPTLPREVLSTQSMPGNGWEKSPPEEQARRSVYIFVKRTLGVPFLETFDVASPDTPTPARATTTIAPQALILLNSQFVDEQALAFADRLLRQSGSSPERNIQHMFRLALGRSPTARELNVALEYCNRDRQSEATAQANAAAYRQALARVCKVVINLNEMVYVD